MFGFGVGSPVAAPVEERFIFGASVDEFFAGWSPVEEIFEIKGMSLSGWSLVEEILK